MKISLDWIKDFIDISGINLDAIESKLTDLGLESKIINDDFTFSNDIVLGKIVDIKKHSNADKLNICLIDIGEKNCKEIICGAANVKKNIYVPVAKIGSTLNNGNFKLSKVKIRGIYSYGMICSGKELGINDNHEGILIINKKGKLGSPISKVLTANAIIDIDLTPNRGDCFSHLGVARELSFFTKKNIKIKIPKIKKSNFKTTDIISVNLKSDFLCKKYSCRIIKDITVTESPRWLRERLENIGQKSINNVVDAANYIMFDQGQPLHAFDYDKIKNKIIAVRLAKNNEKIISINKELINLTKNDIIISDGSKPIALAGIVGSDNSYVTKKTKNILVESAVFDELYVRRSSKYHNISTESSKRFERGVDFNNSVNTMNQYCELIQNVAKGKVASDYVDIIPNQIKLCTIQFDTQKCNQYLGTRINKSEINKIFKKLSIKTNQFHGKIKCQIPSYRNDLKCETDLFEEVARIYGYNNIPSNTSFRIPSSCFIEDYYNLDDKIKLSLSTNGFNEHYSNSLISNIDTKISSRTPIKIKNSLSSELAYLRNNLIAGILKAISFNINRGKEFIKIYEIGNIQIYDKTEYNLCKEKKEICIAWNGNKTNHWIYPNYIDIYTIKGELELLFNNILLSRLSFNFANNKIKILIDSINIGTILIVEKAILANYNIKNKVYIAILDYDRINTIYNKQRINYKKPTHFPSIKRDIAILISNKYDNERIEKCIYENGGNYLKKVELFDYYTDDNIDLNKKSLAYSMTFKANDKTLIDNDIAKVINKIIKKLNITFKAIQR